MTTTTMRTRLLATSMISGAALAAVSVTGAQAQTAPAPAAPAAGTSVGELVITGSRIPSRNLTSVSPVTTVNNQEIKLQGTTNVEDLINNLPQAFADFGTFESNGASGTSTIDLRGLGDQRTLVLVDGKRLQPGDPTLPVADINMIPPALIDRVEVLTGGASAVYGSDAVAGVVNFIMKHNFQGLQIDTEVSIGEHGNNNQQVRAANANSVNSLGFPSINFPNGAVWTGRRNTVTITGGANTPDDKGNVEFYLGYTSIEPVLEAKYDWSSCGLSTDNTDTTFQYCGGSSTDATGRLKTLGLTVDGENVGAPHPGNYNVLGATTAAGLLAPFGNGQVYNFAPLNYIQRPDIRYTAGEFSHYEYAPWLDIYSSFMFMDDHSVAQIAPSGSFFGENTYNIPCNDPLLSATQANTLCGSSAGDPTAIATATIGRRDVEGAPRFADLTHTDYRIVFGAKGDLGSGWTYDISGQYGRSILTSINGGYFLDSHLDNALDVIPNPAVGGVAGVAAGAPVCAAALPGGSAPACVPYNLWSAGGVTPAALAYLNGVGVSGGYTTEQVVTATVAGDLGQYGFKSPWASDGVGISIGGEYRREFLSTFFDSAIQGGDLAGFGGSALPTQGSQSDKDIFGEIRIPIVQNMPFAKDITFEGGYRYSDYTSGGGNNTYKLGLDWQVVADLRLRGSYERAVRAPNVQELFAPQVPGLIGATDPCGSQVNPAVPAASAQYCANTLQTVLPGATAASISAGGANSIYENIPQCVSGQCGIVSGGNPALSPETAKTYSFGFVFTPTFFRGFSLSADYFNIKVEQAIVNIPFDLILNSCGNNDDPIACGLIHRNPGLGYALFGGSGAGFINLSLVNAGLLATNGVDVNANYRTSLSDWGIGDYGSLNFSFTGTYVHTLSTTFPGETYDCAGLYGTTCGTPTPKWRHQLRLSWITPWNLTLSGAWRYLSPTSLDFNTGQAALQNGFTDVFPSDAHIPAFSYFDVSFQWKFRDRYTVRGGVNNVFDRTPPLLDTNSFGITGPAFGNANTFPQVFDPLGRVFFLGLTADF